MPSHSPDAYLGNLYGILSLGRKRFTDIVPPKNHRLNGSMSTTHFTVDVTKMYSRDNTCVTRLWLFRTRQASSLQQALSRHEKTYNDPDNIPGQALLASSLRIGEGVGEWLKMPGSDRNTFIYKHALIIRGCVWAAARPPIPPAPPPAPRIGTSSPGQSDQKRCQSANCRAHQPRR